MDGRASYRILGGFLSSSRTAVPGVSAHQPPYMRSQLQPMHSCCWTFSGYPPCWGRSLSPHMGAGANSSTPLVVIARQAPCTKPLSLPSHEKPVGREPVTARGRGFLVYLPSLFRAYSRSSTLFWFWRRRHSAWRTPGLWDRTQGITGRRLTVIPHLPRLSNLVTPLR
jgi:hypothetical protein